jgi:phosphatidylglycerophosphate synthase
MRNIAIIYDEPLVRGVRVYGLSPVERLVRQCRIWGVGDVWIVTEETDDPNGEATTHRVAPGTLAEKTQAVPEGVSCYLIGSDTVVDDRLLAFLGEIDGEARIATRSGPPPLLAKVDKKTLRQLSALQHPDEVRKALEYEMDLPVKYPSDFDPYIDELRLCNEPYLFRLTTESDVRRIENRMYEANFKGTLDFIAIYIYKYPVREITRWLSRFARVTPSQITFLSIVSSFAVPVLFAMGQVGWAVSIGWLMFILDSVDGKLARLTVRLSKMAGIIEHATSSPAVFLWFPALAWSLTDGRLFDSGQPVAVAAWMLMALYWVDKSVNGAFRKKFRLDLYNWSTFDQKFHLIACRRAIIMFIITLGYLIGDVRTAYLALASWMAASFAVHLLRFAMIYIKQRGAAAGT